MVSDACGSDEDRDRELYRVDAVRRKRRGELKKGAETPSAPAAPFLANDLQREHLLKFTHLLEPDLGKNVARRLGPTRRRRRFYLVAASPDLHATMRHFAGAVTVSPLFSSLNVGLSRTKVQTCIP